MPNWSNILCPISLIGNGRSGTSLVSQVFSAHPDITYIGETVNLIQSTYYSIASGLPKRKKERIPELIRNIFTHLYPTKEKYWFHKPIGAPIIHSNFKDIDQFCEWYWKVFDRVFPHASCFTVLRHPYDVIVSSVDWWGRPEKSIIKSNYIVAKIISHPSSRVKYAVHYEELLKKPEENVRGLFNYLGIDYHPDTLKAFDKNWSVKGHQNGSDLSENVKKKYNSKKEKWDTINQDNLTQEFIEATNKVWEKFDLKVEWKY